MIIANFNKRNIIIAQQLNFFFFFYLESVSKNDVWVHSTNIQMVNNRILQPVGAAFQFPKTFFISAQTSSKFVTCSIGTFSSTSIACFIVRSTAFINVSKASGTCIKNKKKKIIVILVCYLSTVPYTKSSNQ